MFPCNISLIMSNTFQWLNKLLPLLITILWFKNNSLSLFGGMGIHHTSFSLLPSQSQLVFDNPKQSYRYWLYIERQRPNGTIVSFGTRGIAENQYTNSVMNITGSTIVSQWEQGKGVSENGCIWHKFASDLTKRLAYPNHYIGDANSICFGSRSASIALLWVIGL